MSRTILIHVTDEVISGTSKKTGKPFSMRVCYVFVNNLPYPEKVTMFNCELPTGKYQVPFSFRIFNNNIVLDFDFTKAIQHQAAQAAKAS